MLVWVWWFVGARFVGFLLASASSAHKQAYHDNRRRRLTSSSKSSHPPSPLLFLRILTYWDGVSYIIMTITYGLGWSIGQTYAPLSTNTRPRFALHRVEYRQTYASLSTKTRPSPFLCIRWSLGRNLCSTLHGNLLVMIPIYLSLQSRLAGNSSATRKALTTRSCEVYSLRAHHSK